MSLENRRINIWYIAGFIGLAVFFLLRFSIDFNAESPHQQSKTDIEIQSSDILKKMGYQPDTALFYITRSQKVHLYKQLSDTLGLQTPSPALLQSNGVALSRWLVRVIDPASEDRNITFGNDISIKNIVFEFNDSGNLIYFKTLTPAAFFIPVDSLADSIHQLIFDTFGYESDNYSAGVFSYSLDEAQPNDNVLPYLKKPFIEQVEDEKPITVHYHKIDLSKPGPKTLSLNITPKINLVNTTDGTTIEAGISLNSFNAIYLNEQIEIERVSEDDFNETILIFILSIGMLIFVVFVSVRQIFLGRAEWGRALIIFTIIFIAISLWRIIYFYATFFSISDALIDSSILLILLLNSAIFSLFLALYGAAAYMGYESLARKFKLPQLDVIDGIWQGRFLYRETGEAILNGYTLSGVLLGVLALILYAQDAFFYQFDSQFGFGEANSPFPSFTIPLNAFGIAWLTAFANIGILVTYVNKNIKNKMAALITSWVLTAIVFTGLGRSFATSNSLITDLILFLIFVIPILWSFEKHGLFTVIMGIWSFTMIILLSPLIGSNSTNITAHLFITAGILLLPFIVGFIAYKYGDSIATIEGYVPEYEERLQKQLRVEKEIEIARESQFTLMPLEAPKLNGIELSGFFLPSFEVGGDYYDYVLKGKNKLLPDEIAITIFDVSGKAMKAAMHAVHTSGLILSRILTDSPEQVLTSINPIVYNKTDSKTFITAIVAQYNFHTNQMIISNAGHCHPVLKKKNSIAFLKSPDPRLPLGFKPSVDYKAVLVQLEPGDTVFFYSDGLPEAVNSEKQRYGFDTTLELFDSLDTTKLSCEEMAAIIKKEIQLFSNYQMVDDTTVVCMKIV